MIQNFDANEQKVVTQVVLKWLSKIVTTLLILLLVLMLFVTISSKVNGGAPKVFGKEIFTVLSGSMEPGIKTGSIIAVKPVGNPLVETFKKGDVITFKAVDNENMLITHRIVDVQGTGANLQYVTRGDNNDAQDPLPVPAGNVVAQYANFTIPYLGYILSWVKTKVGIAVLLFVPGVILFVQPLISLYRSMSREDEDTSETGDTQANANATLTTTPDVTPDATPTNG
ncbi:MAG: signal peptidase I SipW [Tumebacillaceae bacterium]